MPRGASAVSRPKFRLTPPVVAEHPLQAQIARILTIEIAPPGKVSRAGVVWFAVDHANYAGQVPGIRLSRGIIAGLPDVFVYWLGRGFLIELKTAADDARLSEPQRAVAAAALMAGIGIGVVTNAEQVLACLDTWHIPRNRRVAL